MSNLNFSPEDGKAVDWCEKNYPELTTEYKKIMMNQYVLFSKNIAIMEQVILMQAQNLKQIQMLNQH